MRWKFAGKGYLIIGLKCFIGSFLICLPLKVDLT